VLVYNIECHIVLVFIGEVTLFYCYFVNIDFVNIYFQISYIEYQMVFDIYEVLTRACIYQFIVSLFSGRDSTWLLLPVIFSGYKIRTICLVVICEGGNLSLSDYPLASSKPQVTGDVSSGPNLPKEKEPSHRGDIRWDRLLLC
jgi:hypothetical protein